MNKFTHDGKEFEIRVANFGNKVSVKVFQNNQQVSPEYSVDIETHNDYFIQHKESLTEHLVQIAKTDIENEIYYQA